MGIFKDTHAFILNDLEYKVVIHTGLGKEVRASVEQGCKIIAEDINPDATADDRTLLLEFELKKKDKVRVEAGWISLTKTAIAVFVDNKLIYESSPGKILMAPLEAYGLSSQDIQGGTPTESEADATDDGKALQSDSLDERDKSFDTVLKRKRGYTGVFLAAFIIVAAWNILTNRPGIDTVIMASAVFVSGIAAHTLLRVSTISGGAVGIAAFLLSYGLFQQFVLGNDSTNKLGFTFTTLSITIGYVVYSLYYLFLSKGTSMAGSNQTLPNSEIRRSLIFFTVLALGNTVFALYASGELFGLWSLTALVLIFYYIFSPYMKSRNTARPNPRKGLIRDRLRSNKTKEKKKSDSDHKPKAG